MSTTPPASHSPRPGFTSPSETHRRNAAQCPSPTELQLKEGAEETPSQAVTQPLSEEEVEVSQKPGRWGVLRDVRQYGKHDLCKPSFTIGRSLGCDLTISQPAASKVHCRLTRVGGDSGVPVLEDLSQNGTHVNGRKLAKGQSVVLDNNDQIDINPGYSFVFRDCQQSHDAEDPLKDREFYSSYPDFYIKRKLGCGNFSQVLLGISKKTGERFAVKKIAKHRSSSTTRSTHNRDRAEERLESEIRIMESVNHPNLIRLHNVIRTTWNVYLFLELLEGGELFEYINQKERICEREARFLFYQVICGLDYLHSRNITHRDIKPENIFMVTQGPFPAIKIGDFGLAKETRNKTVMRTLCGTYHYLAPEVIASNNERVYDKSVDVWSCGVLLYVILFRELPFPESSKGERVLQFPPEDWLGVSLEVMQLVRRMLRDLPELRPAVKDLFETRWMKPHIKDLRTLYRKRVIEGVTSSLGLDSPDRVDSSFETPRTRKRAHGSDGSCHGCKR